MKEKIFMVIVSLGLGYVIAQNISITEHNAELVDKIDILENSNKNLLDENGLLVKEIQLKEADQETLNRHKYNNFSVLKEIEDLKSKGIINENNE